MACKQIVRLVLVAAVGCVLYAGTAWAETESPAEPVPTEQLEPGQPPPTTPERYRVVIVPFRIEGGREGTRERVNPTARQVFQDAGFEVVSARKVQDACSRLGILPEGLLPDTSMLSVGQSLGARYVVAGEIAIRSKRTWHLFGPRAKSEVFLKTKIVDTEKSAVVFAPHESEEYHHDSDLQKGVGLLVSLPLALFMGGSISKTETRALENGLKNVYERFFSSEPREVHPIVRSILAEPQASQGAPPVAEAPSSLKPPTFLVFLVNGDRLSGTIMAPEELTITTSYGSVTVGIGDVAKITLSSEEHPSDTLLRTNGDKLSGSLDLSSLWLNTESGEQFELKRDQIKSVETAPSAE